MTTALKSAIAATALIGGAAVVTPSIYSSNITTLIKKQTEQLKTYGITLTQKKDNDSYFVMDREYEATIDDVITLISKFYPTIPTYQLNDLRQGFDGTKFLVHLHITKYPVYHKNAIIISLESPNPEVLLELQKASQRNMLAKKILDLITKKGISVSLDVDGASIVAAKLKDINFNTITDNGYKTESFDFKLNGVKFTFDEDIINSDINNLALNYKKTYKDSGHMYGFDFSMSSLKSSVTKNGELDQKEVDSIKNVTFKNFDYYSGDTIITLNNISSTSAITSNLSEAGIKAKLNIDDMNVKSNKISVDAKNFKYAISISNIDAKVLKDIINTIKNNPAQYNNYQAEQFVERFIKHGFSLSIDPISVDKVDIKANNQNVSLEKLSVTADATLKPNNMNNNNYDTFAQYFSAKAKINTIQKTLDALNNIQPGITASIEPYIVKNGDKVSSTIEFKNNNLYINGKIFR
jgi:hypothetical protein